MRDPTLKVRSRPSIRGRFSRVAMDKKGQPQPCGRKRTWASLQNIWDDDNDGDLWPYSCKESTKAGLCHFFTLLLLLLREYVDLRGCSHGLRRYARWRLFSFRSVCGPPLLLCTAVAFSFVDVLHTVLFSHILYTYLYYIVQEKSLFEATAVVVEAAGGRVVVVVDDGVILGTGGGGGGLCWKC